MGGFHHHNHGRQLDEGIAEQIAGVLTDEREGPVGAVFRHVLETDDGTRIEQEGSPGANGTAVIRGSYS